MCGCISECITIFGIKRNGFNSSNQFQYPICLSIKYVNSVIWIGHIGRWPLSVHYYKWATETRACIEQFMSISKQSHYHFIVAQKFEGVGRSPFWWIFIFSAFMNVFHGCCVHIQLMFLINGWKSVVAYIPTAAEISSIFFFYVMTFSVRETESDGESNNN